MVNGIQGNQVFKQFQVRGSAAKENPFPQDKVEASSSSAQPYIIMPPKNAGLFKSNFSSAQVIQSTGAHIEEELSLVGGFVANVTPKQAQALEKKGFQVVPDRVENFLPEIPGTELEEDVEALDGTEKEKPVEPFVPRAKMEAPRFNTPLASKFTGKGVSIAVLDSGVFPHPDFNGRLLGQVDFVNGKPMPYDDNGHGTHVAGCAAGDGGLSDGIHKGLASEANIIGVKVLAGSGSGRNSDIIKGIQWCIEHKDELNIRVINMSLGGPAQKDYAKDPLNQAVQAAYEAGIVVLAAAGNEGPGRKTVGSPGDSPYAITIGAADDKNTPDPSDDTMAEFSSRGPTKYGAAKPDLVAPGEGIFAALAPGTAKERDGKHDGLLHESLKWLSGLPFEQLSQMPKEHFKLIGLSEGTVAKMLENEDGAKREFARLLKATSRVPLSENSAYQALPGTSMATPIVAGLVASMFEANPELSPDQVKEILTGTADKLPGKWGVNSQGAGMVDPEEALLKSITTTGTRAQFMAARAEAEAAAKAAQEAKAEKPPEGQPAPAPEKPAA